MSRTMLSYMPSPLVLSLGMALNKKVPSKLVQEVHAQSSLPSLTARLAAAETLE
jgi:hypothetical protein